MGSAPSQIGSQVQAGIVCSETDPLTGAKNHWCSAQPMSQNGIDRPCSRPEPLKNAGGFRARGARLDRVDAGTQLRSTRLTRREDTRRLRVGWRKWRNGLADVPVIGDPRGLQGLSQNEIGCARISMMARKHKCSMQGPDMVVQETNHCHFEDLACNVARSIQMGRQAPF